MARPMPREPPVTRALAPSKDPKPELSSASPSSAHRLTLRSLRLCRAATAEAPKADTATGAGSRQGAGAARALRASSCRSRGAWDWDPKACAASGPCMRCMHQPVASIAEKLGQLSLGRLEVMLALSNLFYLASKRSGNLYVLYNCSPLSSIAVRQATIRVRLNRAGAIWSYACTGATKLT